MGNETLIEWADATLGTAWGCTKVSPGCDNCYMYRMSPMYGRDPSAFNLRKIVNIEMSLRQLAKKGKLIVFVNSMTDTFHEKASFELIKSWFDLFKEEPHQFLILTKRINKAYNFFKEYPCPDNCWIGTSIEGKNALHRLRKLKRIDAKIKYVSFEPMIEDVGNVDLSGIQWAIVGGESGAKDKIRPFNTDWAINIRDLCKRDNVPFFYKQSGGNRKINGVWGSDMLHGKKYLEMPVLLATKDSSVIEKRGELNG